MRTWRCLGVGMVQEAWWRSGQGCGEKSLHLHHQWARWAHLRGERPIHWLRRPQQQEAMAGLKAAGLGKTRPPHWGKAGDGGSGCSKGSPLGCSLNRENYREESISSLLICEIFQIKNNHRRWRPSLHGLAQHLPHLPSYLISHGIRSFLGWGWGTKVVTSDEASC